MVEVQVFLILLLSPKLNTKSWSLLESDMKLKSSLQSGSLKPGLSPQIHRYNDNTDEFKH